MGRLLSRVRGQPGRCRVGRAAVQRPIATSHPTAADDRRLRSRALRRAFVVGVAVVVATAALVGLAVNRSHRHPTEPSPVSPAASPITASAMQHYTVFYTDQSGPRVIPLDGGPRSTLMPAGPADSERPLQVSGGVVFLRRGLAYFLATPWMPRPSRSARPITCSRCSGRDLVGVQRGLGPGPVNVQFVSTTQASGSNSPVWQLPAGYQALARAGSGLLVRNGSGQLRVWSLDGGQLGPVLADSGTVIDTRGNEVAWRANTGCDNDAECPLHITNASTGADRVVSPRTSHGGFLGGGASRRMAGSWPPLSRLRSSTTPKLSWSLSTWKPQPSKVSLTAWSMSVSRWAQPCGPPTAAPSSSAG
jgi:hypothetical protein